MLRSRLRISPPLKAEQQTRHDRLRWRWFAIQCWQITLIVLPLWFDPVRVENFESPKAALAIVFGLILGLAAFFQWWAFRRSQPAATRNRLSFLTISIVIWLTSCSFSALFSLSPARSIEGDLYRRMGLLTQVSFMAALVGASLLSRRQRPRVFFLLTLVGTVVAVYGILERLGLSPFISEPALRPSSTLGVHVRAASWLIIVILWALVAILMSRRSYVKGRRYQLLFPVLCLITMLIFLILTQARGAVLGLIAGLFVLAGIWVIYHRGTWQYFHARLTRILMLIILLGSILGGLILFLVKTDHLSLTNIPLVGRLNGAADGETAEFRLMLWASVEHLTSDWPTFSAISPANKNENPVPTADHFAGLRPLIGYGQEMLEIIERRYFDAALRATDPAQQLIDRAHNVLLDTLATQGWLGLLALGFMYLAVAWTSIRVLRSQGTAWNEQSWLAALTLAVLIAHIADLQFTFTTVASEWLFWATVGLLVNASRRPPQNNDLISATQFKVSANMVILVGGVLAWSLGSTPLLDHAYWMVGIVVGGLVFALMIRKKRLQALILIGVSATGILIPVWIGHNTLNRVLLLESLPIIIIIALLLIMGTIRKQFPRRTTILLTLILLSAGLWYYIDASADSLFQLAQSQPANAEFDPGRAELALIAARMKPLDDRIQVYAGQTALSAANVTVDQDRAYWETVALAQLNRASALNGYDATISVQYAFYYTYQAELIRRNLSPDNAAKLGKLLARVEDFYREATQQWPTDTGLLLDWARFTLSVQQNPQRAIQIAEQARQLVAVVNKGLPEADAVIADAQRALALPGR